MMTPLQKTKEFGANFWNDSCDPKELTEAVHAGARGATSNPVIVHSVIKNHATGTHTRAQVISSKKIHVRPKTKSLGTSSTIWALKLQNF